MTLDSKEVFLKLMLESCNQHKQILQLNLAVAAENPGMTHLLGNVP